MLQLIIGVLLSMGFNIDSGEHFTMNSNIARQITQSKEFNENGGEEAFAKYVYVDDQIVDDIVIVDDDNPSN